MPIDLPESSQQGSVGTEFCEEINCGNVEDNDDDDD